jgi:fatty acid desaturase
MSNRSLAVPPGNFEKVGWWQAPARSFTILAAYAACACPALMGYSRLPTILLWPVMGFILSSFLNAAHDRLHRAQSGHRTLNHLTGLLWCTPIFLNYTVFRIKHLLHHKYNGVPGDTEREPEFHSLSSYLVELTGFALWNGTVISFVRMCRGNYPPFLGSDKQRQEANRDNGLVALWGLIVVTLTLNFTSLMFALFWGPLLFYPAWVIICSLPEHYHLRGTSDVTQNTRTITSNAVVRFFLWNANYHADHHANPTIPTINLHAFYTRTKGVSIHRTSSYLRFHAKIIGHLIRKESESEQRQQSQ